jgi:hypothetical protein
MGTPQNRLLHWVIRSSNLRRTLAFLTDRSVCNLRVLRHEENAAACPITCNGRSGRPWSKTMVGWGREDSRFCLEVTCSYGVQSYPKQDGEVVAFGVRAADPSAAATVAVERHGCTLVTDDKAVDPEAQSIARETGAPGVVGPDSYLYFFLPQLSEADEAERFAWVALAVDSSQRFETSLFYSDKVKCAAIAAGDTELKFVARKTDVGERTPSDWQGRIAIGVSGGSDATETAPKIETIYEGIPQERVIHELRTEDEGDDTLGALQIAIVRDPAMTEVCLVTRETFDAGVVKVTDFKGPDWEWRHLEMGEPKE